MRTALANCTVIDCTGRAPQKDMLIVIDDDRIAELRPWSTREEAPRGDTRFLDLEGRYVLPGLWDVHVHLGDLMPDTRHLLGTESPIDTAIRAGRNAMDALRVGITGMRVLGDRDYIDVAWKRAFEANVFMGPRLFVSGKYICATGGHGWSAPLAVQVDGPYEMRKTVREQLRHGADWIKLAVTGGISTAGEGIGESQFLPDEIQAATDIAHQKGKRVSVHAGGPRGIKTAIEGGVDCIEHGYYMDDEAIEMMVEKNVFYVPTIHVTRDVESLEDRGFPEFMISKTRASAQSHHESLQKALQAGLKIACGADASPVSEYALREIECLVKAGMAEMDALVAATRTAADLCQVVDQFGTVEVGKVADLIVLSENPLDNITNIRKLELTMKGGKIVEPSSQEGLEDFYKLFY